MQDGGIFFPSRLSTTFHTDFFRITYQSLYLLGIICTENLHPLDLDVDWTDFVEKTLNCLIPAFLGIYAEWWDIDALLLLSKFGILESWNFRIFELLNFWIFEFLNFWTFELLNIWIFECLNFWIFEFLNFWIRIWNVGVF